MDCSQSLSVPSPSKGSFIVLIPPGFAVSLDKFLLVVCIAAAILLIVCLQGVYNELKSHDQGQPPKDRDARMRRHNQAIRLTLQGLALVSAVLATVGLSTNFPESLYMVPIFEALVATLYFVYLSKAHRYMEN